MTAVEWIVSELRKPHADKFITHIIHKALEMEREQIKQAQQVQKGDYCAVCGCREFWNDEEE